MAKRRSRRKASAAVRARLKALRKKHGLGEFKKAGRRSSRRSSTRKLIRSKSVTRTMPRKKSRSRSKSKHGDLINLAVMGVGAGFSGLIGAKVEEFSQGKLAGNTAQLAAGAAMYFFGGKIHRYVKTAGAGVLVKAVGDYVEDNIVPQVSNAISSSSQTTSSNTEDNIII